jgi:hypothetical protein
MNRKTAEKIAAIVLFAVLAIIFVIQNAHALGLSSIRRQWEMSNNRQTAISIQVL